MFRKLMILGVLILVGIVALPHDNPLDRPWPQSALAQPDSVALAEAPVEPADLVEIQWFTSAIEMLTVQAYGATRDMESIRAALGGAIDELVLLMCQTDRKCMFPNCAPECCGPYCPVVNGVPVPFPCPPVVDPDSGDRSQ